MAAPVLLIHGLGHPRPWPPIKMPRCQMANLHSFVVTGPSRSDCKANLKALWLLQDRNAIQVRCRNLVAAAAAPTRRRPSVA